MKPVDYSSKELKVLFLSHKEFRASPYWAQVRDLVDAGFKRDRLPGETLANDRTAFMRGISPGKTARKQGTRIPGESSQSAPSLVLPPADTPRPKGKCRGR